MKPVLSPTATPVQTPAADRAGRADATRTADATRASGTTRAAGAARDPRADKVRHAANEFESMLVKQLLKAAHIGASAGSDKANGYGDMAVDALASAIEHGGGLGLANRIQQALHMGVPAGHPGAPTSAPPAQGPSAAGAGPVLASPPGATPVSDGAPAAQTAAAVVPAGGTAVAHSGGDPPSTLRLKVP